MSLSSLFRLLVTVGGTLLVAISGSFITTPSIDPWYNSLQKPLWNPSAEWFGPVWTTLYILMAIAAFLVWQKGCHKKMVQVGLSMYAFQLGLNFLWSFLFFGFQEIGMAAVEIFVLLIFILCTQIAFWRSSKTAALLLIPYVLWVCFASALNFSIWQLNR